MRRSKGEALVRSKTLRLIAAVVLVTFTNLVLQPLIVSAQLPPAPQPPAESSEERYSRFLAETHDVVKEAVSAAPGADVSAKVDSVRAKYAEIRRLEVQVDRSFQAAEQHIKDKALPAEILTRHQDAVAEYQRRKAEFQARMQALEAAAQGQGDVPTALADLGAFMAQHIHARRHTRSDPDNLPWKSPKPVTRKPITTKQGFRTSGLFMAPVLVAQAGSLSGIGLPSTTLPATPTSQDTAPTDDVQMTDAIRDLAASLGNKPVPIYNWVRNNVQFVPSYGSIQGSDMTLRTKRGNAFDTASLLIALLRSANVPARYVYGTIQVPVDQVMNWVGGVAVPEAAMELLGQGGIPNAGIVQGGQVKWIQLEHVWVEAYVDYVPSRGAVNRTPNTWVPLDASFKQYRFTPGADLKTSLPFDAQGFVSRVSQGITSNDAEGWVQGGDLSRVQAEVTSYRDRIANYVNTQKPTAALRELVSTQAIVPDNSSIFLGTLPYTRIVAGATFQAIPDNLRWKFSYGLFGNSTELATGTPRISFVRGLPSLAGKGISLSYVAASAADAAVILSFVPRPHADGTPIQPEELLAALPAYLVRVCARVRVDGVLIGQSCPMTLGEQLVMQVGIFSPATGWDYSPSGSPIAGEQIATYVDAQGVAESQLTDARMRIEALQRKLADPSGQITGREVGADLLDAGLLTYFSFAESLYRYARWGLDSVDAPLPQHGHFQVLSRVGYFFGIPRTMSFAGFQLDVARLVRAVVAKGGGRDGQVAFLRASGLQLSAAEHLVPERLFGDQAPAGPGNGVSAVRALVTAQQLGQRLYRLTPQNVDAALSVINTAADAKEEMRNAVAAGKEVTVHRDPVFLGGWTGTGYIIVDPMTGAGAYKISGGANGGAIADRLAKLASALTGFLISNANAGDGSSSEYEAVLIDILAGVFHAVSEAAAILGAFLTLIALFFHLQKIFENCSGADLIIYSLLVILLQAIIFAVLALIAAATGFGAFVFVVVIATLEAFAMEFLVDAIVRLCQRSFP